MGLVKGGALRIFQSFLYAINFFCAAIILGIYSYFLSVQADRNVRIPRWQLAVEGMSGIAVVYTICAVLLTCCLGGISVFGFLAIVLDILFVGAMIAIAILTREGANSCSGFVRTPLGDGTSGTQGGFNGEITYSVSLRTACRLNTVCFAVAIIGAFFFLITAAMQIVLVRSHKKEKRYGPSPSNNYTSGSGRFWPSRNKKSAHGTRDAELATVGATPAHPAVDNRASYETGTTVGGAGAGYDKYDKVERPSGTYNDTTTANNTYTNSRNAYYGQPQGTGVNPYGYENTSALPPHAQTTGTATNY